MDRKAREEIAKKVAYNFVTQQTSSLAYIRQVLTTLDVDLASKFRDSVVHQIRVDARSLDPNNRSAPTIHLDGDKKLHIHLYNLPGEHPAMLFVVEIPPTMFQQFAFDPRKPTIIESYSGTSVEVPDISKLNSAKDVASAYLRRLRDVVKTGGFESPGHSIVPEPLQR